MPELGWLSILPPILTIVIALVVRKVVLALGAGISVAFILLSIHQPSFLIDFVKNEFKSPSIFSFGNIQIALFTLFIALMVAVIVRNGGMQALVVYLQKRGKSKKKVQLSVWLLGVLVFFDDYANSLIVGNTMRPLTDKYKISRAKLAYLVDSTAAPVAAIAIVSTWAAYELEQIENNSFFTILKAQGYSASSLFVGGLKYAFYPLLTLVFIGIGIFTGREFGPMLKAERETSKGDDNTTELDAQPTKIYFGVLPILVLLLSSFGFLFLIGVQNSPKETAVSFSSVFAYTDSVQAIFYGSIVALLFSILLTVIGKATSIQDLGGPLLKAAKQIGEAIGILFLAWALSYSIKQLETGKFVAQLLDSVDLNISYLPMIVFAFSAVIAFATGTSFGTMGIMYPTVFGILMTLMPVASIDIEIVYACISAVLGGAVFGDHCSPISDTTILSSAATGCNHLLHVKTQIPYALTVAGVSITLYLSSILLTLPLWLVWGVGGAVIFLVIRFVGRRV